MRMMFASVLLMLSLNVAAQEPWRIVEVSSGVALAIQSVNGTNPKQATVGYFFAEPTDTYASGDASDYTLVGMEFDCYSPQTRALVQKSYRLDAAQPLIVGQAIGKWERVVHPSQQKAWESVCGVKDHALQRVQTPKELIAWLRSVK